GHCLQHCSCSSICSSLGVCGKEQRHTHFRVSSAACAVPVARNSAATPAKKAAFIALCPYSGSGLPGHGRVVVHSESHAPKGRPSLEDHRDKGGRGNKGCCSNRGYPLYVGRQHLSDRMS